MITESYDYIALENRTMTFEEMLADPEFAHAH